MVFYSWHRYDLGDISPMPRIKDKEQLEKLAKESNSIGEIARKLNYKLQKQNKLPGGVYKHIKTKLVDWQIDIAHFVGQGWAKGLTKETDCRIHKKVANQTMPWDDVFKLYSRVENRTAKGRLISSGKKDGNCEICCSKPEWNNKPLRMELDHINGINNDFREENLRILCPNCHSQTETHSLGQRKKCERGEMASAQE